MILILIVFHFYPKSHVNSTEKRECMMEPPRYTSIQNRNILVTGAAGFIGMHTCLKLQEEGHRVIALDSVNSYYSVQLKRRRIDMLKQHGILFVQGNVCDADILHKTIQSYKVQQVVHLAAQAGVRYSLDHPQEYIKNNVECFVTLLETLVKANIRNNALVYASSSSVYGLNKKFPFSETDQIQSPNSLYAATKFADEVIAKTYFNLYGIKSIGLRFFTVYGPWGRPDMAYYIFAQKIRKNETITIYDHGNTMRDYTYVDDIVNGVVSSLYANYDSTEVLNLGNNKPVAISTFVKTLEFHMGQRAKIRYTDSAKGDVPVTFADISKASCMIAYKPVTDIDYGIKKFVTWFNQYEKDSMSYAKRQIIEVA